MCCAEGVDNRRELTSNSLRAAQQVLQVRTTSWLKFPLSPPCKDVLYYAPCVPWEHGRSCDHVQLQQEAAAAQDLAEIPPLQEGATPSPPSGIPTHPHTPRRIAPPFCFSLQASSVCTPQLQHIIISSAGWTKRLYNSKLGRTGRNLRRCAACLCVCMHRRSHRARGRASVFVFIPSACRVLLRSTPKPKYSQALD